MEMASSDMLSADSLYDVVANWPGQWQPGEKT